MSRRQLPPRTRSVKSKRLSDHILKTTGRLLEELAES